MKWLSALISAVIGYNVGWYSVAIGSHGGDAWPTLLFCGPIWPFAASFGDTLAYVWAIIYGTATLYAAYGWCLFHFRWWKVLLTIALVHTPVALLTLVL